MAEQGNSGKSGHPFLTFLLGLVLGMVILAFIQKFSGPAQSRREPTPDLLRRAAEAFYAKDYAGAEKIYEDVLMREPENFEANKFLGTLWAQFLAPPDYKKSLYYIRKALESRKDYKEMVFYADILIQNKDYAESEAALRDCLKETEKDAHVWEELGYVLRIQTNYKEALKAYQTALKLDPKSEHSQKAVKELQK